MFAADTGLLNIPYDSMSLDQKLAFLHQQLDALAKVMFQAKETQNASLLAWARQQYTDLSQRAGALRVQASEAEAPSSFMRSLDSFSDEALTVVRQIDKGLGGVAQTAQFLPVILIGLVAVIGIGFYKGSLRVQR